MSTTTARGVDGADGTADWIVFVAGLGIVLFEAGAVYASLGSLDAPEPIAYGATAAVVAVAGGSFLYVARRRLFDPNAASPGDRSTPVRAAELIVSIVVLVPLTVFVGNVGGGLLALSARVGGPDPTTGDGDPLRNRLLAWSERNREFMRTDGEGDLPMKP